MTTLLLVTTWMTLGSFAVPILPRWTILLPGRETAALAELDATFRGDVEKVLADLRRKGHAPRIAATFRDSARQDFYYQWSAVAELFGGHRATQASGGRSCHNRRDDDGKPASLAVDIAPGPD